jgi:hypothetical protein
MLSVSMLTTLLAPTSALLMQPAARSAVRPPMHTTMVLRHSELAEKAVASLAAAVIAGSSLGPIAAHAAISPAQEPATSVLLALQTTDWTAADYDWDAALSGKPKPPPPPPPAPVDPKKAADEKKAAERAAAEKAKAEKKAADEAAKKHAAEAKAAEKAAADKAKGREEGGR